MFFFCKQKTAYEIDCDWSSDVCSSDLVLVVQPSRVVPALTELAAAADVRDGHGHSAVEQAQAIRRERGGIGDAVGSVSDRSEERRVGEEGRSRWSPDPLKKKKESICRR